MVLCFWQFEAGQELQKVTLFRDIPLKHSINNVKRRGRMGIINCMFQRTTYEVSDVSELASDVQLVLSSKLREQYNGKLYKNVLWNISSFNNKAVNFLVSIKDIKLILQKPTLTWFPRFGAIDLTHQINTVLKVSINGSQ